MRDVVVRGFGYAITHAVRVPETALEPMSWPSPAYPFTGVRTPIIARCGKRPRSVQDAVVVMERDTTITCELCEMVLRTESAHRDEESR